MSGTPTMLVRLLEQVSWEGNARPYRDGGRGRENVLTAEVFQALDALPRAAFLGRVLDQLHGGDKRTTGLLCQDVEDARFELLPPAVELLGRAGLAVSVTPDVAIHTNNVYALVEAKSFGASSFQPEQLARELLVACQNCEGRVPLLVLVLPKAPPILVKGHGRLSIGEAIAVALPGLLDRIDNLSFASALRANPESFVSWTTWSAVAETVGEQAEGFSSGHSSVNNCVRRLAAQVTRAVAWHAKPRQPNPAL